MESYTAVLLMSTGIKQAHQFALIGLSSSLHSEACNAVGASDGVIHSSSMAAPPSSPQTSPCSSSQPSSAALAKDTPSMELWSRCATAELSQQLGGPLHVGGSP